MIMIRLLCSCMLVLTGAIVAQESLRDDWLVEYPSDNESGRTQHYGETDDLDLVPFSSFQPHDLTGGDEYDVNNEIWRPIIDLSQLTAYIDEQQCIVEEEKKKLVPHKYHIDLSKYPLPLDVHYTSSMQCDCGNCTLDDVRSSFNFNERLTIRYGSACDVTTGLYVCKPCSFATPFTVIFEQHRSNRHGDK